MDHKQLEAVARIAENFKAQVERSGMPNETCRDGSVNMVFVDVRLLKQLAKFPLEELKDANNL
jgi:hypothetical protein